MSKSIRLLATRYLPTSLLIAATLIYVAVGASHGASSFALTNGGNITTLGDPLTENFDTLINTGTATWTNNGTIPGWYHARTGNGTTIVANNGGSTTGNL